MRFLVSSVPENLAAALEGLASATVEAEYGDVCVPGSVLTMAHHGPRAGGMAPCAYPNGCGEGVEVVGLSHVDLDSFGGCMALLGIKPEVPGFWELAEYIDLNGPHKLGLSGASEANIARIQAFWAWSQTNRTFPPRDGTVADITEMVEKAASIIQRILADEAALLAAGADFAAKESALNADSFLSQQDGVIVRVSGQFTNHLYTSPGGEVGQAVVGYNTRLGSITISFADSGTASAVGIVQLLWGPLAGGHRGIAGSPRGQRMTLADLTAAVAAVVAAL